MSDLDEGRLLDGLNRFFGPLVSASSAPEGEDNGQLSFSLNPLTLDRQRLAAAVAVARNFAVISGGPGTGKTATAGKILALIVEQAFARGLDRGTDPRPAIRIAMVAPTGKAAATLSRSMKQVVDALPCDAKVKEAVPTTALTIHRCLGVRGGAMPKFRHDANNPLPIDTLLVDEASMVDLALMTRLLAAVPKTARVILLGDEYQLASVEAGAVLGDICASASTGYSRAFASRLEQWVGGGVESSNEGEAPCDIQDSIVRLTHSYRYGEDSGIGALARAINGGDGSQALEILDSDQFPDVTRVNFDQRTESQALFHAELLDGFAGFLSSEDPEERLRKFSEFRVLSPQRAGSGGVEELNRQIEAVLRRGELIRGRAERYAGRPLIIKTNDYAQSLWNGDVGVVLGGDAGVERVVFDADRADRDAVRTFAYARLPECETAFAMTIHKSQGSEFDRVAVVLTDAAAERATRELLYTAVTRARSQVTLYGSKEAIAQAIGRKIQRASGLGDALRSSL
jgi:exodeoxyribonuclease V alpha subunit